MTNKEKEKEREWEYRKTKGTVGVFGLVLIFIITFFDF